MSVAWDAFISHASEDKDAVARPLAVALQEAGLRVWYDEFSMSVGDGLMEAIDRGLAESRFGIVVLSPSFLTKRWTRRELDGLATRQLHGDEKVLLPIWHRLAREQIEAFSPPLADILALNTSAGVDTIVRDLVLVIKGDGRATASRPSSPVEGDPSAAMPVLVPTLWYPARPLIDSVAQEEADNRTRPVMNSAFSPEYGDERAFLRGRRVGEKPFVNAIEGATEGDGIIELQVRVRNCADPSANATGTGVAVGAHVRVALPTATGQALRLRAYVSIDNPASLWPPLVEDTFDLVDRRPFRVAFAPGSAHLTVRRRNPYGDLVDTSCRLDGPALITEGVKVGYEGLDGRWPAGEAYAGSVRFSVRATPGE